MAEATSRSRWLAGEQLDRAERLIAQTDDLASDMNMRFLYDAERKLFAIGYNVSERRMDTSYYDLLASEARLGSFVSIARGDVPVGALAGPRARLRASPAGRRVLLSWSGTMFEYLMPLLLTRSFENSLLDEACRQPSGRADRLRGRGRTSPGASPRRPSARWTPTGSTSTRRSACPGWA